MAKGDGTMMRWVYWLVLAAVSLWVLASFLTPSDRHSGLNLYPEIQFPKMVQGTAHRPFVYRTLLPTTVRVLEAATPKALREKLDDLTARQPYKRRVFHILGWERQGSIKYYYAALLMWGSFLGFAHFATSLTCRRLGWRASALWRTALGAAVLLGLPAFFKYSSFSYDPPQLFLFTLALYLLSTERTRGFFIVFLLCCLNKETAALLIPIQAAHRWGKDPVRKIVRESGLLIAGFVVIKGGLAWVFRDNPGAFMEFHLWDHNKDWLLGGWSAAEVVVIVVVAALVLYRWRDKPRFLRIALVGTLPVQVLIALFYGFIDEWRIYYEAYAVVFGLVVATVRLYAGSGLVPESPEKQ
ncbi:MAG: hypothetical protein ABFS42_02420 [Candidatus Krumholzibacteriota bacterium]